MTTTATIRGMVSAQDHRTVGDSITQSNYRRTGDDDMMIDDKYNDGYISRENSYMGIS
jgi:hypothetical protein